jgi:hypothetical protein
VAEECQDHLGGLWNDCTADTKADLASLSSGPIPLTELPKERQRSLKEKGYGVIVGNQMRSACRIITRYAESQSAEVQNMRRLFGDSQRFDENIQNLLELRLNQVSRFNVQLLNYLQNAIRDLYPDPAGAIAWMRQIADHALDLIWEKELPRSKTIPAATLSEWKYAGVTFRDMEKGILPSSRGTQCYVLRLMVGTKQGDKQIQRVARYVRKPTYLLVDYIQSVGDFGQHLQGNRVPLRFAASVCLAAIELVESLAADFGTN